MKAYMAASGSRRHSTSLLSKTPGIAPAQAIHAQIEASTANLDCMR